METDGFLTVGYSYFDIIEPFTFQGQHTWSKYADYEYINEWFWWSKYADYEYINELS